MAGDTLFGIPMEEVHRQLNSRKGHDYDPSSDLPPISPNFRDETLDPCIRGGKKISADPILRARVQKILKGRS